VLLAKTGCDKKFPYLGAFEEDFAKKVKRTVKISCMTFKFKWRSGTIHNGETAVIGKPLFATIRKN
jgi:hypothetical protein